MFFVEHNCWVLSLTAALKCTCKGLPLRISLLGPQKSAALDGLLYNSSLFAAKISLRT